MNTDKISPEVKSIHWGNIEAGGHTYKDVKLFPGGSRAWDWNETGTRHVPGIQPADTRELLDHGADIIVLSRGINKRLQTCQKTKAFLEERGCQYFILQSERAVEKYNSLRGSELVGALIHSTC